MKKGEIKDRRLRDIVDRILAVSAPEKIILYGSRARKENGSRSDFDIAILGDVNSGKVWGSVQEAKTLLHIDIIFFNELSDEGLKKKILDEGVILYER